MARLNRKLQTSIDFRNAKPFVPFDVCMRDYHSQAVCDFCADTYSKLEAIRKLQENPPERGAALDIVRALLTDHELLFPQTRERFYVEPYHSLYRHKQSLELYHCDPQNMGVHENTGYTERMRQFAQQAWEDLHLSITLDRIFQALEMMLEEDPEDQLPEITTGEDVGYCNSELGALEQSAAEQNLPVDAAAAEAIMETWLRTVQLKFSNGKTVPAYDYLKRKGHFTVIESFEFLSGILDRCKSKETMCQICCSRLQPYEPVLAIEQQEAWEQQIVRFHAEDLSRWKEALPALEQYLHLDTTRFEGRPPLGDMPNPNNSEFESSLYNAFRDYLHRMEPLSKKKEHGSELEHTRPKFKEARKLAVLFVNSICGPDDEAPLFMDLPSVIFHLFRSPVFRHIHNLEDRNWGLVQTVKRACVDFPLPITCQSLDDDEALYFAIVDVCEAYCKAREIPLNVSSWRALWDCIRQSVLCLSFQKEDLRTVQYCFRDLLLCKPLGYPLLDQVLATKMDAPGSFSHISLWRMLVNQAYTGKKPTATSPASSIPLPDVGDGKGGIRVRRLQALQANVALYRPLFEDAHDNLEQVVACITQVLKNSRFNRIAFLPKREEWKEFLSQLQSNASEDSKMRRLERNLQKLSVDVIKKSCNADNRPDFDQDAINRRTIEIILAEWLLLQWHCQAACRELMCVVEDLLREP